MEANNTSKITATITGENGQPLNLELRHDRDGAYRWYQDGQDTEVSGDNIADAIAAVLFLRDNGDPLEKKR